MADFVADPPLSTTGFSDGSRSIAVLKHYVGFLVKTPKTPKNILPVDVKFRAVPLKQLDLLRGLLAAAATRPASIRNATASL